jgi:hypothetical protein
MQDLRHCILDYSVTLYGGEPANTKKEEAGKHSGSPGTEKREKSAPRPLERARRHEKVEKESVKLPLTI